LVIQFRVGPYCDISEIFVFVYRTIVDDVRQTGYTCDNDGANAREEWQISPLYGRRAMSSRVVTGVEADTNYLWSMKCGLAVAVAAKDKEKVSEYRDALLMLITVTESKSVRIAAWRALAAAETPVLAGPSDTVRPFVKRVAPVAALAVIAAACSFAATPSMTDPPATEMAVAYELPVCAVWIDRCE
jgi:hypothetical protein